MEPTAHRTLRASSSWIVVLALVAGSVRAQSDAEAPSDAAKANAELYAKREVRIKMRDGVGLFTAIYTPKAPRKTGEPHPILMRRTPYSVSPYGEDKFPDTLGPSDLYAPEGYIFVYQDVRGRYMSEGEFVNMRPHIAAKKSPTDVDESTDTYDTIEWLLANVEGHNGKVGLAGISYPGFYSSAGMIDAHKALVAVSPQAPIADWFFDDFFHHGAFFLPHAFNFFASFGQPRPEPTTESPPRFQHGTPDGYQFFIDLGPLANADERYLQGHVAFWNEITQHPNYDDFWRSRNVLPHLKGVAPAVLVVGGWFDAEDLYGAINTYHAIEDQNPGVFNALVMGPWSHGGWSRSEGKELGNISFGANTSEHYRKEIELAFFNQHLKGAGDAKIAEATMFETGANRWRTFEEWPPRDLEQRVLHFREGGALAAEAPGVRASAFDEYVSDPAKPVPFSEAIAVGMTREYMTDDQRFAARRPDVLAYQTAPLQEDVTIAGPLVAELFVSTSGTDSDWVVKLIDVFPPSEPEPERAEPSAPERPSGRARARTQVRPLGGYQMMVRSEVIRGRFRSSYARPEPFVPNRPTRVDVRLQDVLHTFKQGHRIMVQVQSSWFPLVDRNPQKFVPNIFEAREEDFEKAVQRVYHTPAQPSALKFGVLKEPAPKSGWVPAARSGEPASARTGDSPGSAANTFAPAAY